MNKPNHRIIHHSNVNGLSIEIEFLDLLLYQSYIARTV